MKYSFNCWIGVCFSSGCLCVSFVLSFCPSRCRIASMSARQYTVVSISGFNHQAQPFPGPREAQSNSELPAGYVHNGKGWRWRWRSTWLSHGIGGGTLEAPQGWHAHSRRGVPSSSALFIGMSHVASILLESVTSCPGEVQLSPPWSLLREPW